MRRIASFIVVGVGLLASNGAYAQTCTSSNVDHLVTDARREFRVSSVNDGSLSGVTDVEFQRGAAMAAATWNEQSNSRPFFYNGLTSRTDLPSSKADCDSAGINYSLVKVDATSNASAKGSASGRCTDGNGNATQFLIKVNKKTSSGSDRVWEANGSTIGSNEYDLLQTLTHEFGHTLHLGHPSGEYGTMRGTSIGTNKQRDLYLWDLTCVKDLSQAPPERATKIKRLYHSGGTFGSESTPFGGWIQSKGSPGITWVTGSTEFSAAAKQTSSTSTIWWTRGHNQSNTFNFPTSESSRDLIGMFTETTFREDTNQDRVFWVRPEEYPTPLDDDSSHRIRYRRSSNGFSSSNSGNLKECNSMTGFLSCSSHSYIQSGKPPAISWDYEVDRTVFAWVNQNRDDNSDSREIRIAIGYVDNFILPVATKTGIQSNVTPGIACRTNQADGHNCLMAYVDQRDGEQRIKLRRFTPVATSTGYSLVWHPSTTTFTAASTASRIALWYHDSRWWMAYRTNSPGQWMQVFHSMDSLTWSALTPPSYTDVGPVAISYWAGNNTLFFAE